MPYSSAASVDESTASIDEEILSTDDVLRDLQSSSFVFERPMPRGKFGNDTKLGIIVSNPDETLEDNLFRPASASELKGELLQTLNVESQLGRRGQHPQYPFRYDAAFGFESPNRKIQLMFIVCRWCETGFFAIQTSEGKIKRSGSVGLEALDNELARLSDAYSHAPKVPEAIQLGKQPGSNTASY